MTEAEKLLLSTLTELSKNQQARDEEVMNTLSFLEGEREAANKATLDSLRQLAQRVEALERLSGQVTLLSERNKELSGQVGQLSEQNRELIEQLRQLSG